MDVIALLKKDHATVKALFSKFEAAGDNAHALKRRLVDQITVELSRHAVAEEEVVYPMMRERLKGQEDDVLEALEEHHVVKLVLAELEKLSAKSERFDAKVTVMIENVKHHIEEEEEGLFPKLKKALTAEELKLLGAQVEQAKKRAPTRPHPGAPDEPPGNVIAGAFAKVLDTGVDLVKTARRQTFGKTARKGKSKKG